MIERDGPGAPWRFSDPAAAGLDRDRRRGGARTAPRCARSSRSSPQLAYPPADDLPEPDPNVPPPILPPFPLPGDGYLLRETASGWEDEQRTAFAGSGADRPIKSDPVLALLLDSSGGGWAVGGWSGTADSAGRGIAASGRSGPAVRERVQTATVFRFGAGADSIPTAVGTQPVPMPAGPIRLRRRRPRRVRRTLRGPRDPVARPRPHAERGSAAVAGMQAAGPGRVPCSTPAIALTGLDPADGARYAALLGAQPGLPVYPAMGSDDVGDGSGRVCSSRPSPRSRRRSAAARRRVESRPPGFRAPLPVRARAPTTPSTAPVRAARCA